MSKLRSDFTQKVENIKEILKKYNGIPSQKDNKSAYSTVSYFLKNHSEEEEIKTLIDEYNLRIPKRADYNESLKSTEEILKGLGRFPSSTKEKSSYQYVRKFFLSNEDKPEVEKLMFIYAYEKCFPLPESKQTKPSSYHYDDPRPDSNYIIWRRNASYKYVAYVYKKYGVFPAPNTKPMEEVLYNINRYYEHTFETYEERKEELYGFLKEMVDLGCREDIIYGAYVTFLFMEEDAQERVRKMLIENGCCSVRYISRKTISEAVIPEKFVFFYYFIKSYCLLNYWEKPPVVRDFFKGVTDYSARMIYVNYRDYHLCDVDKIRKEAQAKYKNWDEVEPQTDEEWKAFGQWWFFAKKIPLDIFRKEYPPMDWNKTIIDDAKSRGISYFIFYNKWNYIDYILYLVENNCPLTEERMLEYFKDGGLLKNVSNNANVARTKMQLIILLKEKRIKI
jgi:hypothetical protein